MGRDCIAISRKEFPRTGNSKQVSSRMLVKLAIPAIVVWVP